MAKRLVARPRPYTSESFEAKYPDIYHSGDMIALRQNNDTYKSFPSGHTSNAAATYFTSAALISAHYDDPKIASLSYAMASILTGLQDTLEYGMASTTLPTRLLGRLWVPVLDSA